MMARSRISELRLDRSLLRPGMRLGVAVSGGADSVALLLALNEVRGELGLTLHVVHLHHGLRGPEADGDLDFVRDLAAQFDLPFHTARVDTPAEAAARPGKPTETIEEAARRLRYRWFRDLLLEVPLNAIATAHTLDDQAETVLAKILRGAWTEGLSGVHPTVQHPEGLILRPFLAVSRSEIESYLRSMSQSWREDSSNRHLAYTRNRIRHEVLPLLDPWNPRLREHLAQMAELARDEEAWWSLEIARIASGLIVPGRPVRGGGRAAAEGIALDVSRLAKSHAALQRRILRYAAGQLGLSPDFRSTESMRQLVLNGRAGQKYELAHGLRVERSHRELRLSVQPPGTGSAGDAGVPAVEVPVPGEVEAPDYGFRIRVEADPPPQMPMLATLRVWKPGDRVTLEHSGGPRKVKEVLERLKVAGEARTSWPVLELSGRIIWMQGVSVQSESGIRVKANSLEAKDGPA